MTKHAYADELEAASNRIDDFSKADLASMLHGAALWLRNSITVPLEPEWEEVLTSFAAEKNIDRNELASAILKDWIFAHAFVPAHLDAVSSEVGENA